jgi:hypothetical protein
VTTEINIDGVTYRGTPDVTNNCIGCVFGLDDKLFHIGFASSCLASHCLLPIEVCHV